MPGALSNGALRVCALHDELRHGQIIEESLIIENPFPAPAL
jgi:hypothetical protein